MTLHIELDEEAETAHFLVDDHLILFAERRTPTQNIYKNFDALVDDKAHDTLKKIAALLLDLTAP